MCARTQICPVAYFPFYPVSDELLQSDAEARISHSRQQQEQAGPLQTSQDQRLVAALAAPAGDRVAGVQLPRRSWLRCSHPSPASPLELLSLFCILHVHGEALPVSVTHYQRASMSDICLFWAVGQDKDFVVWLVCIDSSHRRQNCLVIKAGTFRSDVF